MFPAANRERVRLSISVPVETKNKLSQLTHFQGKRMSDFIRETIEEKMSQMDRQNFEAQMKMHIRGWQKKIFESQTISTTRSPSWNARQRQRRKSFWNNGLMMEAIDLSDPASWLDITGR